MVGVKSCTLRELEHSPLLFNVNNNSNKLIISFNTNGKPREISRFKMLFSTGLIVFLTYLFGFEIFVLAIFLLMPVLASAQVKELHFNKDDKTLNAVYSIFGKVFMRRNEVKDYSICTYSIVYEIVNDIDDKSIAVYALRATEYYYHYDLHHFDKFSEASEIGKCLRDNLDIKWDDTPPDTSLSRILRSL